MLNRQARLDDDFEETLQLGNTDYSTAVALLTVGSVHRTFSDVGTVRY